MSGSWMSQKLDVRKAERPIKLNVRKAVRPVVECPKAECPRAECLSVVSEGLVPAGSLKFGPSWCQNTFWNNLGSINSTREQYSSVKPEWKCPLLVVVYPVVVHPIPECPQKATNTNRVIWISRSFSALQNTFQNHWVYKIQKYFS